MKRIITNWFKKYRLHILIWIVFILYESFSIGFVMGAFGNPITYVAHYSAIILLFYLHADWFLPWSLKNTRTALWKFPVMLTLEIVLFIEIAFFIDKLLIINNILLYKGSFTLNVQYGLKTLFRNIYFMGFATGYYFLITYNKEKRKTNELEKQRLNDIIYKQKSEQELTKAQNAFLKAQINPHFLFNTLDFVYHSIVSLSPPAADAVATLAEMMRYAIDSDKMGDFVLLGDEIDQVENLLYLNQIRKNHELGFLLQYNEEVRNLYLIPLVLLTLIENIFKHGNLSEEGHEAVVNIYLKNEKLLIETDNLINNQISKDGGHKGLNNTEQRLKYAYSNEITFWYQANDLGHFKVKLSIPVRQLKSPGESLFLSRDNDIEFPHEHVD